MVEVEYTYVDTEEGIAQLSKHLEGISEVALDTEADNLHHYETRICLVQLRFDSTIYIVDPLCGLDLSHLWEQLQQIHVIMHGSDFDIRLLSELCGFKFKSIFDTMLASQLLGIPKFGLASLLEEYFQLKIPKDSQKSDWSMRPLTPKMLKYASTDVLYLFELRDILLGRIQELGRVEWLKQRCQWQIESAQVGFPKATEYAWRISKSEKLPPRGQAGLYELWHWREDLAQKLDRPPFKVLGNDYMYKLAEGVGAGDWAERLDKMPPGIRRRKRQGIVEAIKKGEKLDPSTLPKRKRKPVNRSPLSQVELERQETMKIFRNKLAEDLGIDPTLIATRSHLAGLSRDPSSGEENLQPWQNELLKPCLEKLQEKEAEV